MNIIKRKFFIHFSKSVRTLKRFDLKKKMFPNIHSNFRVTHSNNISQPNFIEMNKKTLNNPLTFIVKSDRQVCSKVLLCPKQQRKCERPAKLQNLELTN